MALVTKLAPVSFDFGKRGGDVPEGPITPFHLCADRENLPQRTLRDEQMKAFLVEEDAQPFSYKIVRQFIDFKPTPSPGTLHSRIASSIGLTSPVSFAAFRYA